MVQDSSAVWFGAAGFEVTGVGEEAGEVTVGVQTPGGRRVFCAGCGHRARSKGRREVVLRDAPGGDGRPVRVLWNKRIWECRSPQCESGSWTERSELAGPRRVLTFRAERWAAGRLAAVEGSVASAARRLGVSWRTVWSAVAEVAEQVAGDPDRVGAVARLGFDETVMSSATRRRRRRFITAVVDAADGQIVDVFDGRDAAGLRKWVSQQPRWWAGAVEVVCVDPHEGYRSAIRQLTRDGGLPAGAEIAADPFHIVRLANQALTACRQRTQTETTGHRGRKGDPLYGIRKLLLPRRPRPPAPAIGLGPRRPLRRSGRLLDGQGESPVHIQNPRPRTGRRPPRRRHRMVRRPRVRARAAPARPHPEPLARRDRHQHPHPNPQRAHRGRQRQNQRRQTLSQRLHQPSQLPAQNPAGSRTKTTRNSTRHKNQNPTSQLRRVEPPNCAVQIYRRQPGEEWCQHLYWQLRVRLYRDQ